jgi:uncharacterized iron-regulated membrane protein
MAVLDRVLDHPRKLFLRRALFQIHLWTGIIAGIYAILIGVTGSVLVFSEELHHAEVREWRHVPIPPNAQYASVDQWVESARKVTGPGGSFNLVFPEQPGDTAMVNFFRQNAGTMIFLNPYTAQVLGVKVNDGSGLLRIMERFHSNLLIPRTGRLVNGIGALALLLLAITGIIIWWPGRRLFRKRLTIKFDASWKRINFDFHHAVGFWGMLGFSLLCITGAWFTWPQFFRNTVAGWGYTVTPPQRIAAQRPAGAERLPISELIAAANAAVPGPPVSRVNISAGVNDPIRLNKAGEGKPFFRTATVITVNPYTREVLRVDSLDTKASGDRILSWMAPLHIGNFGGMTIKVIWFLLGLTMPALFVSGFIMWWQRVVKNKWLRWPTGVTAPASAAAARANSTASA